jgi:4-amino-4-deoxy-L-arabinose transferase-like glycosyltransferase
VSLYLLAAILRLVALDKASIYGDEITWMVRSKETVYALIHTNWSYFDHAWWLKTNESEAIGLPVVIAGGLMHIALAGAGKYGLHWLSDIAAARLAIVIVGSLTVPAIYYYGKKMFSEKIARWAAVLYAINPIAIGLDRWVLHDSYLTLFSFLSVAAFLVTGREKKISVVPGITLALAFLTKPNGILPVAAWAVFVVFNIKKWQVWKLLLVNAAAFLVVVNLVWPYAWFHPVTAIWEYLVRQLNMVQLGLEIYYGGSVTTSPGWGYYIVQFLIRMPEIILLGLMVGLWKGKKLWRAIAGNPTHVSIIIFTIVFAMLISFSRQKLGIRYALPLVPWITIAAAYGLLKLQEAIKPVWGKVMLGMIVIPFAIYPLSFKPDYYLYYNSLVGGPKGAQRVDMVGWCASSKPAVEYLNKITFKGKIFVVGCVDPVRYYTNIPIVDNYEQADAIVVETYIAKQYPNAEVFNYLKNKELWMKFDEKGATLAEIYR